MKKAIPTFISHCMFDKRLSSKTIKAYKIDLQQFYHFIEQNKYPSNAAQIDKTIIRAYIQSLCQYKPKTIKRKIASAKALFNFLEFDDLIEINPFRKVKTRIKEPRVLPIVMDIPEIKNILAQVYKIKNQTLTSFGFESKEILRDLAIIELLFATGIRVTELVSLKEENIDLRARYIKVKGKGDKERILQICNKEVLKCLKEYYAIFKEEIKKTDGCFFINRLGKQLSDQSVRLMVKKYAKQAGIKKNITPHVFRHSFATLLLEEDVDIKYIQHMLGHSSIAITQIYTHVNQERQRKILHNQHPRKHFTML